MFSELANFLISCIVAAILQTNKQTIVFNFLVAFVGINYIGHILLIAWGSRKDKTCKQIKLKSPKKYTLVP